MGIKKYIAKVMLPFTLASSLFLSYPYTRAQDSNQQQSLSQTGSSQTQNLEKIVEIVHEGQKIKVDISKNLNRTFSELSRDRQESINFAASVKYYLQSVIPNIERDALSLEKESKCLYNEILVELSKHPEFEKNKITINEATKILIDRKIPYEKEDEVKRLVEFLPNTILLADPRWHAATAGLIRAWRSQETTQNIKSKFENFKEDDARELLYSDYVKSKFGYRLGFLEAYLESTLALVKTIRSSPSENIKFNDKYWKDFKKDGNTDPGEGAFVTSAEYDAYMSFSNLKGNQFSRRSLLENIIDWKDDSDSQELITKLEKVEIKDFLNQNIHDAYEAVLKDPKKNADYFVSLYEMVYERQLPLLERGLIAYETWFDKAADSLLCVKKDEGNVPVYKDVKKLENIFLSEEVLLNSAIPKIFDKNFYEVLSNYGESLVFKAKLINGINAFKLISDEKQVNLEELASKDAIKKRAFLLSATTIGDELKFLKELIKSPEYDLFETWRGKIFGLVDASFYDNENKFVSDENLKVEYLEKVKYDNNKNYERLIISLPKGKAIKETHYLTFYKIKDAYYLDMQTSGTLSDISSNGFAESNSLIQIYPFKGSSNTKEFGNMYVRSSRYSQRFKSNNGNQNEWPLIRFSFSSPLGQLSRFFLKVDYGNKGVHYGIVGLNYHVDGKEYRVWDKNLWPK